MYPNDVDAVVNQLTAVEECAAFSYPDERLGEVVAVAIVVKDGCELNERTVKMYCARKLADFQQPHKIFFVDMLPKNTMGKLQRNRILSHIMNMGFDK